MEGLDFSGKWLLELFHIVGTWEILDGTLPQRAARLDSGVEVEDELYSHRTKSPWLHWKESGRGDAKLDTHKNTGRILS